MNNQIITGSLDAIAQQSGKSIAETFVNAEVIIIVDTSGSMNTADSRDGKTRYAVACEELTSLQNNLPGRLAIIAFSNDVQFCPSGIATYLGGGTNLTKALQFVKIADVPGMKFILISDGRPNDEQSALATARMFRNHIDVIFVGSEEYLTGREFLQKLAAATGGQTVTADKAKELTASVTLLLGK
jgi:Mg-chelatase subunit ChlD